MFLRALIFHICIYIFLLFFNSTQLCLRVKMMKKNKREWKGVVGVEFQEVVWSVLKTDGWGKKEKKERAVE